MLEIRARVWYNEARMRERETMYSMTGYGKGEYRGEGTELTVEVKSVNNRYLDVAVKGPRVFLPQEELIRARVRESISRGHVDVFVSCSDRRERPRALSLDLGLARSYMEAAQSLRREFPSLHDDMSLSFLLRQPDVVKTEEGTGADETLVRALESALSSALAAHAAMRLAEGERLKADLLSRIDAIAALREKIALRAPLVAEEYRKKLTDRMNEFLAGKVDETRILTEAAVYSDKCNIDEELTRLLSHIAEFRSVAESERVGRKLDFLVQELNRECNTICSKSNDREITALALEMKNEIEKVREQIQNLE